MAILSPLDVYNPLRIMGMTIIWCNRFLNVSSFFQLLNPPRKASWSSITAASAWLLMPWSTACTLLELAKKGSNWPVADLCSISALASVLFLRATTAMHSSRYRVIAALQMPVLHKPLLSQWSMSQLANACILLVAVPFQRVKQKLSSTLAVTRTDCNSNLFKVLLFIISLCLFPVSLLSLLSCYELG